MVEGELTKGWDKGTEDTERSGLMSHTCSGSGCICPNLWTFILPCWTARIAGADWGWFQLRVKNHTHEGVTGSMEQTLPTEPLSQLQPQGCSANLKCSQWLRYWWLLMLSSYSKSKTRWWGLEKFICSDVPLLAPSQACSLRREVLCVFRGGTGQGAKQSQALTKSGSTRLNWGLSDRDTSSCHLCLSRTGHSWGHHLQGKAFPCATRLSTQNKTFQHRGATKMGLTAQRTSLNKSRKGGNWGEKPTAHPAEGSGYHRKWM